jgi:GNAT superfamily N-acetyltransferase
MAGLGEELLIRPALPDDAPAVMAVVQAGFETYRAFAGRDWDPPDDLRDEEIERSRTELADPRTFALLAEAGGVVVAHVRTVAAVSPSPDGSVPDVHFRHLFVREAYWGTGLAKTLHDAAIARLRGTARLYTPAAQARARRFYEREGWTLHHGPHLVPALPFELVEYRRTGRR